MRADIDYGLVEARTTLGRIGVKVWIYKGDILPEPKLVEVEETPAELVTSEAEEVVSAVGREEMPVELVASGGEEVEPAIGREEMPAELVTSGGEEVEPAIGREEMPVELVTSEEAESSVAAGLVETLTEPVGGSVEAAPAVETKAKPTRARTRRVEAAPVVEKKAKPTRARARVKAAPSAEPAENTVKPTADIITEAESSTTEEEEKDVTTEAGETSQDS